MDGDVHIASLTMRLDLPDSLRGFARSALTGSPEWTRCVALHRDDEQAPRRNRRGVNLMRRHCEHPCPFRAKSTNVRRVCGNKHRNRASGSSARVCRKNPSQQIEVWRQEKTPLLRSTGRLEAKEGTLALGVRAVDSSRSIATRNGLGVRGQYGASPALSSLRRLRQSV